MRQATWFAIPALLVILASAVAAESEILIWEDDGYDTPLPNTWAPALVQPTFVGIAATRMAVAVAETDRPPNGASSVGVLTFYDAVDGARARVERIHGGYLAAICADERTFYAAGGTPSFVRAYDTWGGKRWEVAATAYALAVDDNRVYALTRGYADGPTISVRAYASDTGGLEWEQSFDPPGDDYLRLGEVAAHGGRVFVSARTDSYNGGPQVLVAFAAADGDVLWSDVQGENYYSYDTRVAAGGEVVAVRGFVQTHNPWTRKAVLRVHDAREGTIRWSRDVETRHFNGTRIAVDDTHVYYASSIPHTDGRPGALTIVRAVGHAAPGDTIWSTFHGERSRSTYERDVLLRGDRLYVTGNQKAPTGHFNYDLFVAAHDTKDGRVIWSDTHDYADAFDSGGYMAASQQAVFVGGGYQIHRKHPIDPASTRSKPRQRTFLRAYADRR